VFRHTVEGCWLPTPFASFPFTSPPVRHRVPSGSERAILSYFYTILCTVGEFLFFIFYFLFYFHFFRPRSLVVVRIISFSVHEINRLLRSRSKLCPFSSTVVIRVASPSIKIAIPRCRAMRLGNHTGSHTHTHTHAHTHHTHTHTHTHTHLKT